ncbi:aromatic amino acid transaminase [Allosphingosinicella sp.]|uniref:amino acid aminotransferase n=1 Tax=Allosphingosinicella sp. TaxID=2823234 RepID=UPI0037851914
MGQGFMVADSPMMFDRLEDQPQDPLIALIALANNDPRPNKIDVGVGVFRDSAGNTPILKCVKIAEQRLVERQPTKAYIGSQGDAGFVELIRPLVFGEGAADDGRIVGLQTPGGCGALRLGAELITRATPGARIHVGEPTWPNHAPLIASSGIEMVAYPYYDKASTTLLFDRMMAAFNGAEAGDLVLLHGCCHNPTGADLSLDQWREVADVVSARGLIPFVDLAYQGFGDGLEADAQGARMVVAAAEQALVAQSCDKNFSCYRDRLGTLWVKGSTPRAAANAYSNLLGLARTMWSMPPDHPAAVAHIILEDPELRTLWMAEVDAMGGRIRQIRARLAAADPRLAYIGGQKGMFSMLPITPDQVLELREQHGIYMAGSGRFNVVGMPDDLVDGFAAAVVEKLDG